MPERERFFECVFVSEGNEYQFHFRAWSEAEAEQHLRDLLLGYGIRSAGRLLVRDQKGRLAINAAYPSAEPHHEHPLGGGEGHPPW